MRNSTSLFAGLRKAILALIIGVIPIGSQAAEQTIFYHLDALGSPIAATDEGGNLLWREEYQPYGDKIQNDPASTINSRAFTGHPHDDTTGLTYAGARHYDPVVGRFMGVDPAPFVENNIHSFNRYAYGNNNPFKYIDRDGRVAETALDVVSLGLSIYEYRQNPSFWNGVGVAVDAIGTVVPFVPAGVGMVRQVGKGINSAADASGATNRVTAPFKSGDVIVKELSTGKGSVEIAAETVINGRTLHLKDIAVYPKGTDALSLGTREVMALRNQLAAEARGMGFDTLRITGTRLTGANPGKTVDLTIDLTK